MIMTNRNIGLKYKTIASVSYLDLISGQTKTANLMRYYCHLNFVVKMKCTLPTEFYYQVIMRFLLLKDESMRSRFLLQYNMLQKRLK